MYWKIKWRNFGVSQSMDSLLTLFWQKLLNSETRVIRGKNMYGHWGLVFTFGGNVHIVFDIIYWSICPKCFNLQQKLVKKVNALRERTWIFWGRGFSFFFFYLIKSYCVNRNKRWKHKNLQCNFFLFKYG